MRDREGGRRERGRNGVNVREVESDREESVRRYIHANIDRSIRRSKCK